MLARPTLQDLKACSVLGGLAAQDLGRLVFSNVTVAFAWPSTWAQLAYSAFWQKPQKIIVFLVWAAMTYMRSHSEFVSEFGVQS